MKASDFRFEYRTRVSEELFGDARFGLERLQVECLESLDQTIDSLFDALQETGNEALLEELCPYFGQVWPSARALTQHLCELRDRFQWRGQRVLELGCGLAIPSLLLARFGAHVVATDFHPEVPRFLERNRALNGNAPVDFLSLNWQTFESRIGEFDWVIGSDILYERQHPEWVARAFCRQLSPGTRVVLADPARPYLQNFVDEMTRQSGRRCETRVERLPSGQDIFLLTFG